MTDQLTEEEAQQARERLENAFDSIEQDENGEVSLDCVRPVWQRAGGMPTEEDCDEVRNEFCAMHPDATTICKSDLVDLLLPKMKSLSLLREELRECFKKFDVDDNGFLDQEEFRQILMSSGNQALTEEECEACFQDFDVDQDGKISLQEVEKRWLGIEEEVVEVVEETVVEESDATLFE